MYDVVITCMLQRVTLMLQAAEKYIIKYAVQIM